jgi:hypothetical protein
MDREVSQLRNSFAGGLVIGLLEDCAALDPGVEPLAGGEHLCAVRTRVTTGGEAAAQVPGVRHSFVQGIGLMSAASLVLTNQR